MSRQPPSRVSRADRRRQERAAAGGQAPLATRPRLVSLGLAAFALVVAGWFVAVRRQAPAEGGKAAQPAPSRPPGVTFETTAEGARVAHVRGNVLTDWCRERGLPDAPQLEAADPVVVEALVDAIAAAAANPGAATFGRAGQVARCLKANASASEWFKRAAAAGKGDFRWPYYLGTIDQTEGRTEEATAQFQRVLELNPAYPMTHARLGQIHLDAGRLDRAAEHLERYVALRPEDHLGSVGLGRVALARGHAEESLTHLRHAETLGPDDFQVQYFLGQALAAAGEDEAARQHLDKAKTLPTGMWWRGRDPLELEVDQVANSVESLTSEFERLVPSQDWSKLASLAERILERRPGDVSMMGNLASMYRKLGRTADAHALVDRGLLLAPRSSQLQRVRMELLLFESRFAEAIAAAEEELVRQPGDVSATCVRGRALLLLARAADAEEPLRTCARARPDDASNAYVLGEALFAQGKLAEAALSYREALVIDPGHAPAATRLASLPSTN